MTIALRDHATERALLGALLSSPQLISRMLVDERLRPEHFAVESHGIAFQAMAALVDRGEQGDSLTLDSELERFDGVSNPDAFVADPRYGDFALTSSRSYASPIRDLHRRRELKIAALLMNDAADAGDPDKL